MKSIIFSFIFLGLSGLSTASEFRVKIPSISSVNTTKKDFIKEVSILSNTYFPGEERSAIAPFGGVKVTPFLELDLTTLIIVTNSYPGTPAQIFKQFNEGHKKLQDVLRLSLDSGAMSTSDVLSVISSAQLLSRLKLELNVSEVSLSYWATEAKDLSAFEDRPMEPSEQGLATVFEFIWKGRMTRLVLVSSYIHGDSSTVPGYPEFLYSFVPHQGLNWIYLSADGLGHFSANRNNGLAHANQNLLDILSDGGSILLDYPTDKNYHTSQSFGGITFMNGRRDLEELNLIRMKTLKVESRGIFGYCLKPNDEVRIYRKVGNPNFVATTQLKQIGKTTRWLLK